ncbi:MAG: hypothetical protein EA398_04495 [Deltaproteobacteria bacterium]|nr:MAG: hypothetical protein EA398_04495 [Deltaproteobacteria bacterium]
MSHRLSLIGLLILSVLLAVGCGKASMSFEGDAFAPGEADDDRGFQPGTPDRPEQTAPPQPGQPPGEDAAGHTCVLIPGVAGERQLALGQSMDLPVYAFSLATGDELPGVEVIYDVDRADSVAAQLSSRRAVTGNDGRASVRLSAGMQPGQVRVRATAQCSRALDLTVQVLELPTGGLEVRFRYPQRSLYDVRPIEVAVYTEAEYRCNDRVNPAARLHVAEDEGRTVNSVVVFDSLPVEETYTIVATGRGQWGEAAATGCLGQVRLVEDEVIPVEIDLFLNPLDPGGDYDVASKWDFTNALEQSGPVGSLLVEIIRITENPGQGLYDFIINRIRDWVGGLVGGLIDTFLQITGLANVIQDAINNVIYGNETLTRILTALQDIVQVVNNLEVTSYMQIGKMYGDYEVFGIDQWQGISLYWRWDCPQGSPPGCGRIPLRFDQVDLGILEGQWTGRVVGYNQLNIDRHPVDFRYGRLILYMLESVLFPTLLDQPGPIRIDDAIAQLVGCARLADWITGSGDCIRFLGQDVLCRDTVENICTGFINIAFGGILRGFIQGLQFDSVMDIRGHCDLLNETPNLSVDVLDNGEYIGQIFIGNSSAAFDATFCGVVRGPNSEEELVNRCLP